MNTGLTDTPMFGPLVIDPADAVHPLWGTLGGGVFKSTNGGGNWQGGEHRSDRYHYIQAPAHLPEDTRHPLCADIPAAAYIKVFMAAANFNRPMLGRTQIIDVLRPGD